jgi:hypothetical protein
MTRSKQPSMTALALCVAAVICMAQVAIPAGAEDITSEKTLKPLAGISFGVGSKRWQVISSPTHRCAT